MADMTPDEIRLDMMCRTLRSSLRIIARTGGGDQNPNVKYMRYEASVALRIADEIEEENKCHSEQSYS